MATVINGILSRKLPWSLVLLGVALVVMVELLGVRSLTLAVGAYLSIATTLAIFVGGLMRWMVDRALAKDRSPGEITDGVGDQPGKPVRFRIDRGGGDRWPAWGLHSADGRPLGTTGGALAVVPVQRA